MSARRVRPGPKVKTRSVTQVTHVRRCHVCGTVLEARSAAILNCKGCGKHLAPYYYFDESKCDGVSDQGLHWSLFKEALVYNPIWGLSTYWSTESDDKEIYEGVFERRAKGSRKP